MGKNRGVEERDGQIKGQVERRGKDEYKENRMNYRKRGNVGKYFAFITAWSGVLFEKLNSCSFSEKNPNIL
jgi:hypothetical protein